MKHLLVEILAPKSPEQTYLNERLQAAKWLGWEMPAATSQRAKPGRETRPELVLAGHSQPA